MCTLKTLCMLFTSIAGLAVTPFKTKYRTTSANRISIKVDKPMSIPINIRETIYSLSIDATIIQNGENCFTRIVLEDESGLEYLVAESDRFRNDMDTVRLEQFCQETALIEGVVPKQLNIYISNSALELEAFYYSNEQPKRDGDIKKQINEIRKAQVQSYVDRINDYNLRHGKLWKAGITTSALRDYLNYEDKDVLDPYISNIKYYVDGIYEFGERKEKTRARNVFQNGVIYPSLEDEFDWTNYQGQNWMTPVKDQGKSNACAAFAAIGVVEALANIYYNKHIDVDLSEGHLADVSDTFFEADTAYEALQQMLITGIMNESQWPFNDESRQPPVPYPYSGERTHITGIEVIPIDTMNLQVLDSIKSKIFKFGPAVSGYTYECYENNELTTDGHALALIGYGKVKIDDIIRIIPSHADSIASLYSGLINQPYWVFKNSHGIDSLRNDRYNGYLKVIFNHYRYMSDVCFVNGLVIRSEHTDTIHVTDNDGDGYCYWGITNNMPEYFANTHRYLPTQKDADDSNALVGRMIDWNHYEELNIYNNPYWDITGFVTVDTVYNNKRIDILSGGRFNVKGLLYNHNGIIIYVENGGRLTVNGGTIQNGIISPESEGEIIIKNGGQIIHSREEDFEIPIGAKLQMQKGCVKYRDN